MMLEPQTLERMVSSLEMRTRNYLTDEMDIAVSDVRHQGRDLESLKLENLTAVIGIGGPSGLLVAFSFCARMADTLYRRTTASLKIPPGKEDVYRDAALVEIANVIVGNWIADFASRDEHVSMTPPVILEGANRIHHVPNATFRSIAMATGEGALFMHLVGPRNMFDHYLNAR